MHGMRANYLAANSEQSSHLVGGQLAHLVLHVVVHEAHVELLAVEAVLDGLVFAAL